MFQHTLMDYCLFYTSLSGNIHDCPDVYLETSSFWLRVARNIYKYTICIVYTFNLFNIYANIDSGHILLEYWYGSTTKDGWWHSYFKHFIDDVYLFKCELWSLKCEEWNVIMQNLNKIYHTDFELYALLCVRTYTLKRQEILKV